MSASDGAAGGNYDRHQLVKDGRRLGIPSPLADLHHVNLKDVFSKRHGTGKPRPGMRRALELCGLSIEGAHHRVIDDARNIARMLPFILDNKLKVTVQRNLATERECVRLSVLNGPGAAKGRVKL